MGASARPPRSLFFRLSVRLALVGLAFLLLQLLAVVWMYVNNPNDLDQLLVSAEADRIASEIPAMLADAGSAVPADLSRPIAAGTRRAFLIHERGGAVVGRYNDGDLKIADEPPVSFLVIRTQRESWGERFLLSGTRRVTVDQRPYWISVAIAGQGFRPFVPVIFNEIRFHVIFPLALLSLMFLLFNFSAVRSVLRPLQASIRAVDRIDPAQVATRIEAETSSREGQALVSAVNGMLERIEVSVRALRDFAGDAAHELRTPLAIMMLRVGKLPECPEKTKLLEDARRMQRLVNQMLDMSHATALEIDADTRADLRLIANEVVAELTPLAVGKGRSIRFIDAGATAVHGHADAIGRALRNLVENALAHTLPGTAVEVTAGPGARCAVRDQGPGIPAAQRGAVLERFRRLDRARSEGAGLGLAIAATIMRLHGGRVAIDDAPGGGALISLVFPEGPQTDGAVSVAQDEAA